MIRRPPRSTRTDTLFPYTTLFRSFDMGFDRIVGRQRQKAFGIGEAFEFDVQPLADGRIGAVGGDHIVGAILLDRQWAFDADRDPVGILRDAQYAALEQRPAMRMRIEPGTEQPRQLELFALQTDRKSTRLNSSH